VIGEGGPKAEAHRRKVPWHWKPLKRERGAATKDTWLGMKRSDREWGKIRYTEGSSLGIKMKGAIKSLNQKTLELDAKDVQGSILMSKVNSKGTRQRMSNAGRSEIAKGKAGAGEQLGSKRKARDGGNI